MTQQQHLALLNSIMPDILKTRDPKGVMLKCARDHNLSPAQLEHLGQCFNTAKTLVGLEKQANRGDAFNIVDVPEMLSEYVTYDADKAGKPDAVNKKVTKLMKFAHVGVMEDAETGDRYYDPVESANHLPSLFTLRSTYDIETADEGVEKSASDIRVVECNSEWKKEECIRNMKQVIAETSHDIVEKCASLCRLSRIGDWQEMAEDALNYFGNAAHIAIETVEDYMQQKGEHFTPFEMQKCASLHSLARDRHNAMPLFGEILKSAHYKMQAKELLEGLVPTKEEKTASTDETVEDLIAAINKLQSPKEELLIEKAADTKSSSAVAAGMDVAQNIIPKVVKPSDGDRDKYLEQVKNKTEETSAIQKLMLEDPVIGEADPKEVYELYKTVASLSPTLAQRPTTLAPIVREALQYGSLPIQTVSELLKAEESSAKAQRYKSEL